MNKGNIWAYIILSKWKKKILFKDTGKQDTGEAMAITGVGKLEQKLEVKPTINNTTYWLQNKIINT